MAENLPLPHISPQVSSTLQPVTRKRGSASPSSLAVSPNIEVQSRLNKRRSSIGMKGRCSRRSATQLNAADLIALVPSSGSDEDRLFKLVELCLTYAVRSSPGPDDDDDTHDECSKLVLNNMEDVMENIRHNNFTSNLLQWHTDGMVPPDPELENCHSYTHKLNKEYEEWKQEENTLKERNKQLKMQIESGPEEMSEAMLSECLSEKDKKWFAELDAEIKSADETINKCADSWNLLCDETNNKLYQLNNVTQDAKERINNHIQHIVDEEEPDSPRKLLQVK